MTAKSISVLFKSKLCKTPLLYLWVNMTVQSIFLPSCNDYCTSFNSEHSSTLKMQLCYYNSCQISADCVSVIRSVHIVKIILLCYLLYGVDMACLWNYKCYVICSTYMSGVEWWSLMPKSRIVHLYQSRQSVQALWRRHDYRFSVSIKYFKYIYF